MKPLVLALAAAIGLCRPSLPLAKRMTYATILETAQDPFVIIALVDHESGWKETAVSKDKKDYGLGQIRRKFIPKAEWKWLLNGEFNLKKTVVILNWWRETCQLKTGSGTATTVLEGYAGHSRQKAGKWCGQGLKVLKSTVWILARAEVLQKTQP